MTMTKKRLMIALPILLLLFVVSTAMISGTFAKYASTFSGSDTALVARWSFGAEVGGIPLGTSAETALPIWDHNYATNIYQTNGTDYLIAPGVGGSFKVQFTYDSDVNAELTMTLDKDGDAATKLPLQYAFAETDFTDSTKVFYNIDELRKAILEKLANAATGGTVTYDSTGAEDAGSCKIENNTPTPEEIKSEVTVYWRWPYNVDDQNLNNFAARRQTADNITDNPTEWTDANDTAIGAQSASDYSHVPTLGRDDYKLTITMTAVQLVPATPTPEG